MFDKIVIILVIVLGAVAIAQIMKVNELTTKASNRKPGEIPDNENKFNGNLLMIFMVSLHLFLIWLIFEYGHIGLGPAASVQGVKIDNLYTVQWIVVFAIYFIFVTLLFYYSWKYARKKGVKAYYYPHNSKLEMLWTIIPAAVFSTMVVLGLKTWNEITSPATSEYVNVELFAQQFSWTARYSGMNNKLGDFDYKLTTAENPYAIKTRENIDVSLKLMKEGGPGVKGIKQIAATLNDPSVAISKEERNDLIAELHRKEQLFKFLEVMSVTYNDSLDLLAQDDIVLKDSLVLLKGQKYNFHLRSKDVIHSAYMPHFRQQMNVVPGLTTYMKVQPIHTTKEMKEMTDNEHFSFFLLCNKICGGSHFKMKMAVSVLGPEEFLAWQKNKSTYDGSEWIKGNEEKLLEYYKEIASRVEDNK